MSVLEGAGGGVGPARAANGRIVWTSRGIWWIAAAILVLPVFLWAPLSLGLPLGRDQGIFVWVAEVMLDGGLPYADAWDVKGPGAHLLYAVALAVFGKSELAVRLFDLVMLALAALGFLRLGRLLGSPLAGLLGFGMAFLLYGGGYWNAAQPDGWAGIMLLWTAVLLLSPSRADFLGAGLLLGLAVLIKPHYALFGLLPVLRLWVDARIPGRLARLALATGGALLPVGLCVLVYAVTGRFGALWETLVVFNLESHLAQPSVAPGSFALQVIGLIAGKYGFVAPLVAIGACGLMARALPAAFLLLAGTAIGAAVALVQAKFYAYHFMPFDTFAAALVGFGLVCAFDAILPAAGSRAPGRATRLLAIVAVLLSLGAGLRGLARLETMWSHATGRLTEARWQDYFCWPSMAFCYRDAIAAGDFLRRETVPGTPVYVWGFDAFLHFLADRPSPTRFGYNYPLVAAAPEARREAREELMADLARTPPAFIVVQLNDLTNLTGPSSLMHLEDFPELKALIAKNYEPVFRNSSFRVYGLKGRAA